MIIQKSKAYICVRGGDHFGGLVLATVLPLVSTRLIVGVNRIVGRIISRAIRAIESIKADKFPKVERKMRRSTRD